MIIPNYICKTMDIVDTIINRLISMLGLTPSMELKVLKPSLYYHKTLCHYKNVFMQSFLDHYVSAWL